MLPLLVMIILSVTSTPMIADDDSWILAGSGNWHDFNNWSLANDFTEVPNGVGQLASFGPTYPNEDATISLDGAVTLGKLEVTTSSSLTISGSNPITFDQTGSGGTATIRLDNDGGDLTIAANTLFGDDSLSLEIAHVDSTLNFTSSFGFTNVNMTKTGAGKVVFDAPNPGWSGNLTINEGTAVFQNAANTTVTLGGGTLEINGLDSDDAHTGDITLLDGVVTTTSFEKVLLGSLDVTSGNTAVISAAEGARLVLNGGSSGSGDLRFATQGVVAIEESGFAHQGAIILDAGNLEASAVLNHGGGTIINGGTFSLTAEGSLVGTGITTVNAGGRLQVMTSAGNSTFPFPNSVNSDSVVLDGGMLVFAANLNTSGFLNTSTTGGVIALNDVSQFNVGGTSLFDFGSLAAGDKISLSAWNVDSSFASSVVLRPDSTTNTLLFGGGNAVLDIAAPLTDFGGVATMIEHRTSGTTLLSANSTYTGRTDVNGGTLAVDHLNALGTRDADTFMNLGGTLQLYSPTNERLVFNGGVLTTVEAEVDINQPGELVLAGNGTISSPQFQDNYFELSGQISGAGTLSILAARNGSSIGISGNNIYTGETFLSGTSASSNANFRVLSPNAFGSTAAGTTIDAGTLIIEAASQESIRIEGTGHVRIGTEYDGTVTLAGGLLQPNDNITLSIPVVVASPGGTVRARDVTWTSGTTGAGDLTIGSGYQFVINGSLNHDGGLLIDQFSDTVFLNSANLYTGQTVLSGETHINHVNALGTSTSGAEIREMARVSLNVAPEKNFDIYSGTLDFQTSATFSSNIRLLGTAFFPSGNAAIDGQGVFTGEIMVDGDGANIIRGGTFNGLISGQGVLSIIGDTGNEINLNASNVYTGLTKISLGTTNVNDSLGLGSPGAGTIVSNGTLNLNATTNEYMLLTGLGRVNFNAAHSFLPITTLSAGGSEIAVNVASNFFDESVDLWGSRLRINENTIIKAASVRGNNASIVVAAGKSLTINDGTIELIDGRIDGQIVGPGTIVKRGSGIGIVENLGSFAGNLDVERGWLSLLRDGTETATSVNVNSTRHAAVRLNTGNEYADNFFLNNGTGIDFNGALELNLSNDDSPAVLTGSIDLGDQGAILGTARAQGNAMDIQGQIAGGSLIKRGNSMQLFISGDGHTYTGSTDIQGGTVELTNQGVFGSTSEIRIHSQGYLALDNSGTANLSDRIADNIPILMLGGKLRITNPNNADSSEMFGALTFGAGHSVIEQSRVDNNSLTSSLGFASLTRELGSTVEIISSPTLQVSFTTAPTLDDGILGGWALMNYDNNSGRDFVTYASGTVAPLTSFASDINASGAADNVEVVNDVALSANTNINSLTVRDSRTIDLGGFELNVESGGVLGWRGILSNGRLTAGGSGDGELFLQEFGTVSADIVDNPGGAVSLVMADTTVRLSGNNTYTGSTTVNDGDVYLLSETALPTNTDLTIDGGTLQVAYTSTTPNSIDHLIIRGGGELRSQGQNQGRFNFNTMEFQDGTMDRIQMYGNGQMLKTGFGTATIHGNSPNFDGVVTVDNGILDLVHVGGIGTAEVIVRGGIFSAQSSQNDTFTNNITLAGGAINLRDDVYTGLINVTASSEILANSVSSSIGEIRGNIQGSGNLAIEATQVDSIVEFRGDNSAFQGDVSINSGVLRINQNSSLGSGDVFVNAGGRLEIGSAQTDNAITLNGGELFSRNLNMRISGDLSVYGNSFIGTELSESIGLEFAGTVFMNDGARLTKVGASEVTFSGDLVISGHTDFIVPEGLVTMNSVLIPQTPFAEFHILGRGFEELDLSITVPENNSLVVTQFGCSNCFETLHFSGGSQFVSGSGVLRNGVNVTLGASINPGQSPGILTIGQDATIGAGGRLLIELGGTILGENYDSLNVLGDVFLSGLLEVSLIDGFTLSANDSFEILRGNSILGKFSNAAEFILVDGMEIPVTYRSNSVILGIASVVPEPSVLFPVSLLAIGSVLGRRRRRSL